MADFELHSKTRLFCNIESTTTVQRTHSRIRMEGVEGQQVFKGLLVKFAHFFCACLVYINPLWLKETLALESLLVSVEFIFCVAFSVLDVPSLRYC